MSFNKVLALINKKYGDGTIVVASDVLPSTRITSGSLALDVILGGGWPTNQWHEIVGEESNGKTAIALKTIAANQAKDPTLQRYGLLLSNGYRHTQSCVALT